MRVAILGLGMMGGSLGMALRHRGVGRVHAYARREETRTAAIAAGAVDEVHDTPASACKNADVTVLCTPILAMAEVLRPCGPVLARGGVVTDVGSTKASVCRDLDAILEASPASFIGSHPMAGSEQSGMAAARGDLYDGARVVVTPMAGQPDGLVESLREFWEAVGAKVLLMDPDEHDRVVARTSHVPHLAASAIALAALRDADERVEALCGQGIRDTTRIAKGPEDVWHDIVRTNPYVLLELERLIEELQSLRNDIAEESYSALRDTLRDARFLRERLGASE